MPDRSCTRVDRERNTGLRRAGSVASSVLAAWLIGAISPREARAQVVLPPPDPGSSSTRVGVLPDGKLVAFTGFKVRVQKSRGSSVFRSIGNLPPAFRGFMGRRFVLPHPSGRFILLGTAATETAPSSGNLFLMPRAGGEARPLAAIPQLRGVTFYGSSGVLLNRLDSETPTSSIAHLSLGSGALKTVIANIPPRGGPTAVDRDANVFVGLEWHYDPDTGEIRQGEIRRFARRDVQRALRSGVPLDFEEDGVFVTQLLTAQGLLFDRQGDLWVGGGDPSTDYGYFAELNPRTGGRLSHLAPNGDRETVFELLGIDAPRACRLFVQSYSLQSGTEEIFEVDACATRPLPEGGYASTPSR
jgi:hypothetical protein